MSNLLYKYLDINGAIMMLYYSDLMYTNATMFNDPFDCHPSLIDCSNVPAEERKGWHANVIEELHSNRFINNREDLWICCLSKLYDSILVIIINMKAFVLVLIWIMSPNISRSIMA